MSQGWTGLAVPTGGAIPLLPAAGARIVLSTAVMAYRTQGLVLERRIMLEGWTTLLLRNPSL
jgi:VIT1/CCC1 family predicted Fe2+/Mn2+ transporter